MKKPRTTKYSKGSWVTSFDQEEGHYNVFLRDKGPGFVYIAKEIGQGTDQGLSDALMICAAPDMAKALLFYLNAGHKEARKEASIKAKNALRKAGFKFEEDEKTT